MPIFEAIDEESVKDFICCVCLNVWSDPVELKPCSHIFCKSCIGNNVKQCYMCRAKVDRTVAPNRILVNLADEIEVRCCECNWRGPNSKKSEHKVCATKNKRDAVAEATHHAMQSLSVSAVSRPSAAAAAATAGGPPTPVIEAPEKPQVPLLPQNQQRVPSAPAELGPQPWLYYGMSQFDYDHTMALFMAFDRNRSGDLTRPEVATFAKHLNFAQCENSIDRMFASMDEDNTKKVTLHQLCKFFAKHQPDPTALFGLTPSEYHEAVFLFHQFDNGGVLPPNEFAQLAISQGFSQNPVQAQELFEAIVRNEHNRHAVSLRGLLMYLAHRKHMYVQMMEQRRMQQQYQQQRRD